MELSGLQERVVLIVQLRLDRIRMHEAELLALTAPKERIEAVKTVLEDINNAIFPGQSKVDPMAEARKMLEKEVQNAIVMTPKTRSVETLTEMLSSPHQGIREQAKEDLAQLEESKRALRSRMTARSIGNIKVEDM